MSLRRRARFPSRVRAGTMRHLKLAFPAAYSSSPRTRFDQIIQILEQQICKQFKKQIPAFAWKPISVTSLELKIILRTKSIHDNLMTQRGDISMIHADKKQQTFGKRYTLQINRGDSNISLAVAGCCTLYDLLIDISEDGNFLLSHKALLRRDKKTVMRELQLVAMPSGYNDKDSYMYSLSYKRPFKRTKADRTLLKAMHLQRLSLTPEIYADMNNNGHVRKLSDLEFEKMFGIKLLQGLSVNSNGDNDNDNDIISDLRNVHRAYGRLQPYIDGNLPYDSGIKNGSLQDVSQKSLLDAILAQVRKNKKKRQFLPRVAIVHVNDVVGYGLIASEYIPAGTIIGEYCGEISKVLALGKGRHHDNTYFAPYAPDEVPGSEMFVVDARKGGNSIRFINHSDENSNAGWARVFDGKRFRPVIAAVKPIPEGRQILLKYKDSYWSSKRRGRESSSHLPDVPYPL